MMDQTSYIRRIIFYCEKNKTAEEAKQILKLIAKSTNEVFDLDEIASLQHRIKDFRGSRDTLLKCLDIATVPLEIYKIRKNLAKLLNLTNEPHKALEQANLAMLTVEEGDRSEILMEIALSHYFLNRFDESQKIMEEILTTPGISEVAKSSSLYNLGTFLLNNKQFKSGYELFVNEGYALNLSNWKSEPINESLSRWDGTVLPGKTIFILSHGGIGDEILLVRFTENIKRLGMKPVWVTRDGSLMEVLIRNNIDAVLYDHFIENPLADFSESMYCPSFYLPIFLGLDTDQLWENPYLTPSKKYIDKWQKILPKGPKLAVKWFGSNGFDHNIQRTIPVDFFRELDFDGTLINLQLESELAQEDMFNVGSQVKSIEDTLAILWLCDSFVSSCTSVVHMAGAMGKNGIVCAPIASYFAWLGTEGYSNWYDKSLQVVRQTEYDFWDSSRVRELMSRTEQSN